MNWLLNFKQVSVDTELTTDFLSVVLVWSHGIDPVVDLNMRGGVVSLN